jgi:EAL domain-containing protein (putative c-di-GMP-specific phosphodiesterase class I)
VYEAGVSCVPPEPAGDGRCADLVLGDRLATRPDRCELSLDLLGRSHVTAEVDSALTSGGLHRILHLARRHLDMDLAFLTEFTDGKQIYRGLAGDAASFGLQPDDAVPVTETYCRLMTAREIPNAIADTAAVPLVRDLRVTGLVGIGSYVGVPVHLPDGSLYGSLCTVSHTTQPVDERDAKFLRMLAELLAVELKAEQDRASERARIERLIDDDRLEIALQPIVDLRFGDVAGAEALSRFPGEFGPPDAVFGAAHRVGVGSALEWVAARRAFETLPLLAPGAYLAINLAPSVAIELAGVSMETPDLPVDRLVVEITEHAAVENYAVLRDSLATARERGLRLAIDDAGAGYASLQHVVELAPDLIKVDRSLVDGVAEDSARRSVVRAFVSLAADLDAVVVAEGVEREADLDTVRSLGVDAAQGYLFARPSTDRAAPREWMASRFSR